VPVDGPDHRHNDRREEHEEAPEDERVHQARDEPLEQLALAEHEQRLVADAAGHAVVPAVIRVAREDEPRQEARPAPEQAACDGEQGREPERAPEDVYVLFAFRSSAAIAGTISCRSPITA
jgi:hypothetical protein